MSNYIGFALSFTMFPLPCTPSFGVASPKEVQEIVESGDFVCAANPSHAATFEALKERFGIELPIPLKPPVVKLKDGDTLIILQVSGLPRLTDRHEYTSEEVSAATFTFGKVAM